MRTVISLLAAYWLATAGAVSVAHAQTLDKEMPALAASLSKELVAQGSKNVAALDFTDLQGQATELGRFLSEQLSVEMVLAKGVAVLDRANFKSILAEHKLTEEGLVNPANAKKLGEFAGVDTILIGSVTLLDAGIVLTVKAISTESARIVAAGKITFQKTADLQWIANRGLSGSSPTTGSRATSAGGSSSAGYEQAGAIATKDIGPLRVVLKSALPVQVKDARGGSRSGLRISFEFTSRETQRLIVVAANAVPPDPRSNPSSPEAIVVRSGLLDDHGGVWTLSASALTGLAFARAGVHGRDPPQAYSPTEIIRLLDLRDKLGRDDDDPSDGARAMYDGRFIPFRGNKFVSGSTTMIGPGQSIRVAMDFVLTTDSGPAPKVIQINSEIVVGVVAADSTKSYSLQNLTFDRVSLPGGSNR